MTAGGRHRVAARAAALGVAGLVVTGMVSGCAGSTDSDLETALRAVCGEEAEIMERDVPEGDEETSWQEPPLECEVDGHRVEAYALQLLDGSLASQIGSDQDVFFSGNGGTLGWATSEQSDLAEGTLVEIFPLDDGEADMSLLQPLEDDGWETGLGYPEG